MLGTNRPVAGDGEGDQAVPDAAVRSLTLTGAIERTSTITSGRDTRPSEVLDVPEETILPFAVALGLAVFFFGLLIDASVVAVLGVVAGVVALLRWLWRTDTDRDSDRDGEAS